MANYSTGLSYVAKVNNSGSADALRLKQFGGEVLTEFEQANIFKPLHYTRSITNGKSAQFPLIGLASSGYHTPGDWLDSQNINHAEQVITVDGLLTSQVFIDNVDEAMNHYDIRGPYAQELGRELARVYDRNVARTFVLAARAASPLTGRAGGSVISDADMKTDADVLAASFFAAAQTLDEKYVQNADRFAVLAPAQYYLLVQNEKVLDKDFSGSANITTGTVESIAGIPIKKSIHLPNGADDTANTAVFSKYRADYTDTVGIIANKWAVGTLTLADIAMESDYEVRRQGTFMVAKMAVGHGVLRPDCAIELSV